MDWPSCVTLLGSCAVFIVPLVMLLALIAVRADPFPLKLDAVIVPPVTIFPWMLRFPPVILLEVFIAPVVFKLPCIATSPFRLID